MSPFTDRAICPVRVVSVEEWLTFIQVSEAPRPFEDAPADQSVNQSFIGYKSAVVSSLSRARGAVGAKA